ncbi:MAG TPA: cell wall-binding repeat-containing protein, partial [Planctomycetes bacterium]|nr:cell wall-binding repeat-containing protein [Planctomycetota bacterium]
MRAPAGWAGALALLLLGGAGRTLPGTGASGGGDARAILVPLEKGPSWRDLAFLAALSASARANGGKPLVLALPPGGEVRPEAVDFLKRLVPKEVFLLGPPKGRRRPRPAWARPLRASSAGGAALILARTFWSQADRAVLCREDDYASGLAASVLAARLGAPLLFTGPGERAGKVPALLKRLGVNRLLLVGQARPLPERLLPGVKQDVLSSPLEVLSWMQKQGLRVRYLAAADPVDRKPGWGRCLSLAASLLAAGRQGAVAVLGFSTRWKVPFPSKPLNAPPRGCKGPLLWRWGGEVKFGGKRIPFVLGAGKGRLPHLVRFDLNGDADFGGPGEGPFRACDRVGIGGKTWVLTLRPKGRKRNPVTLELTWPPADLVEKGLRKYEGFLPGESFFLCLAGLPR